MAQFNTAFLEHSDYNKKRYRREFFIYPRYNPSPCFSSPHSLEITVSGKHWHGPQPEHSKVQESIGNSYVQWLQLGHPRAVAVCNATTTMAHFN